MARLNILRYPDPRLHTVAKPVQQVDARIRQLVDDMLETMYEAEGVGLAATQVDVHERVIVIDTSEARDEPRVLINPELVMRSDEMHVGDEGCLSVPDQYAEVMRPDRIRARWQDEHGATHEEDLDGLLAVCLQHEMDHLEGVLFIDHLSRLKRDMVLKKLAKLRKERALRAA